MAAVALGFVALRHASKPADSGMNKNILAEVLGNAGVFQQYPGEIEIPLDGKPQKVVVQYAFDPKLQEAMEKAFQAYKPDYGALVAIDASTGRILAMVSYTGKPWTTENLALRATFPAASVFKVVTAAAAIADRKYSADTIVSFNGRNHTLYRSNILKTGITRWTRYMTLKEAFARSINTVFAQLGAYTVGAEELRTYAGRFGFNRKIESDVPFQEGRAPIYDDTWALAESASGFTRENTMSPLQGALMAAAVVNDGVMMEPFAIQSVHGMDGAAIYSAKPEIGNVAVDQGTAAEIRAMMRETVKRGTSRRSFAGFFKRDFKTLDVGGKTGSLSGTDPKGKYDWFIGFADGSSQKVAVAALTIHEKFWKVKSSYLARMAFESYFKGKLDAIQASAGAAPAR
jgi:penicillin-binding protein A